MKTEKLRDVFFDAASKAALEAFKKHNKVPVSCTALVQKAEGIDMIPIAFAAEDLMASNEDVMLEKILTPVVEYIVNLKDPEAKVVLFFVSARAEGMVKDLDTEEIDNVQVIVNAARTVQGLGRTVVYQIDGKGKDLTYRQIAVDNDESWTEAPQPEDIPAVASQHILKNMWMAYSTLRNLRSIGLLS